MLYYYATHNNPDGIQSKIKTLYRKAPGQNLEYYNRRLKVWKMALGARSLGVLKNCNKYLYTFVNEGDRVEFELNIMPNLCKLADEIF